MICIVPDNDPSGFLCAAKIRLLFPKQDDVRIIVWPEDFPVKGDASDWFLTLGQTKDTFLSLLQSYSCEEAEADRIAAMKELGLNASEEEVLELSLPEAAKAEYVGKRVRVPIHVIGKDRTPFQVPRLVTVSINTEKGEISKKKEFKANDPILIQFTRCSETQKKGFIKQSCGLGPKDLAIIHEHDWWNIEEVFVQMIGSQIKIYKDAENGQKIYEIEGKKLSEEEVNRTIYVVTSGEFIRENSPAIVTGIAVPMPKNQYATILCDKFEAALTDVSSFTLTPSMAQDLKIFHPSEGQSPLQKLDEIARDIAANITRRYGRPDFHILVDLVIHSALGFNFRGEKTEGWLTAAVIGDTSQAKTTTIRGLIVHYSAGSYISCETSARTGLKGAIEAMGDHWLVKWGALALNDGRFVVLDEYVLLPEEDRRELREVFSAGTASIGKIRQASTQARVRALLLSNPIDQKKVSDFTHPFQALSETFEAPDQRRLDVGMVLRDGDVAVSTVNQKTQPAVPHLATADLSHALVMWAWSRQPEHIHFAEGSEDRILEAASEISDLYSGCIPLVEGMSLRNKIVRLAVAIAIRLFSSADGVNVMVQPAHVQAARQFLVRIYNAPNFALDLYAEQFKKDTSFDPTKIQDALNSILGAETEPFLDLFLDGSTIRHGELQSMMAWTPEARKERVTRLIKANLLKSGGNGLQARPRLRKFAYELLRQKKTPG
jgi:hypothetical protein